MKPIKKRLTAEDLDHLLTALEIQERKAKARGKRVAWETLKAKHRIMTSITMRDLREHPRQIWTKLSRERDLILTSNGKPIAILSAVSEETLADTLAALRRARAIAAVKAIQSHSVAVGADRLTSKEIQAVIAAVRRNLRK